MADSSPSASSSANEASIGAKNASMENFLARQTEYLIANKDSPIKREKILPSQRIDLSGRPGFATSGDWPKTRESSGGIKLAGTEKPSVPDSALSTTDRNSKIQGASTMPTTNASSGGIEGAGEKSSTLEEDSSLQDSSS